MTHASASSKNRDDDPHRRPRIVARRSVLLRMVRGVASGCAMLAIAAVAAGSAAAPSVAQSSASDSVRLRTDARSAFGGAAESGWSWAALETDLSVRSGYYGSWSRERDESSAQRLDLRLRAQWGVNWRASRVLALRARVAGRFSTDQAGFRFYVRDHVPTTEGLRLGDATVDELYVRWTPTDRFDVRVGRMQARFELVGVARKSLDRNDSPSTEVTWTDGVYASVGLGGGWRQDFLLQRNGAEGPTNVVRAPLDVTGSASPVTFFGAVRNDERSGPWVQRAVDITYIRRSVPGASGNSPSVADRRNGYLALVVRAGIEPGVTALGGRLVLGAEAGFAPTTPPRALLGTGALDDGDGDGLAYQLSANLMEVGGVHSFGLLHVRAGDGWLIAPETPANYREWEGRYQWRYASWGGLDMRLRHRHELRARIGAEERHRRLDMYVRATLRFGASRAQSQAEPAAASGTASRPQ